jgi:tRNA dimethylallyltransferase
LAVLDPSAAEGIDARNLRRTIRALEVIFHSGYKFSDQRGRNPIFDHVLMLGLTRPRDELYSRIDDRIQTMLDGGFVEEVQGLLDQGYSPELPAFSAIGYGEVIAYLMGRLTYEEAVMIIRRQTRVFVRRQANWFKSSDPDIHWFRPRPGCLEAMEEAIRGWLMDSDGPSLTPPGVAQGNA